MKKVTQKIIFLLMFTIIFSGLTKGQVLKYVKSFENSFSSDIATDDSNYFFSGANFSDTVHVDSVTLIAPPGSSNIYIAKFDIEGNLIWVTQEGGTGSAGIQSIDVDSSGNVYTIGSFSGTITIGSQSLTATSEFEMFVAKHDSNGHALWARQITGPFIYSRHDGLDVDREGNVYIAGFGFYTVSFGNDTTLTNNGTLGFVAKYNTNGDLTWAYSFPFISWNDVKTHESGEVYITGYVNPHSAIVGKLTPEGNVIWIYTASHQPVPDPIGSYSEGSKIEVDQEGNSFVIGYFGFNIMLDSTVYTGQDYEIFIIKLDNNGHLEYTKHPGNMGAGTPPSSAIDTEGNYYVSARNSTLVYDGIVLPKNNNNVIAKYSNAGNLIWLKPGPLNGEIEVNHQGEIFETGFQYVGTFVYDSIVVSSTSFGAFIARFTQTDFGVASFTLINADTDLPIMTISNNDTINLALLATQNLNIKVNVDPVVVGSVRMVYDQKVYLENTAPYSLFGDLRGDYKTGIFVPGSHTLSAVPYSLTSANGNAGDSLKINFVVINGSVNTVTSFTLVNADTDEDIMTINHLDTIDLATLSTDHLNIRANTGPSGTKSVRFVFDGMVKVENAAPYALFGDNNGNYSAGSLGTGTHSLSATPYSGAAGSSPAGIGLQIDFVVVNHSFENRVSANSFIENALSVYPNPAKTNFNIDLKSEQEGYGMVEIYDATGRKKACLFQGQLSSGQLLNFVWDASGEPSGMYFLTTTINDRKQVQKLLVE